MNRKYKGSTYIDSYIINGFDIFKEKWVNTGKSVKVIDPIDGEIKTSTEFSMKNYMMKI